MGGGNKDWGVLVSTPSLCIALSKGWVDVEGYGANRAG